MTDEVDAEVLLRAIIAHPEVVLDALREMGMMGAAKTSQLILQPLGAPGQLEQASRLQGEISGLAIAQSLLMDNLTAEPEEKEKPDDH